MKLTVYDLRRFNAATPVKYKNGLLYPDEIVRLYSQGLSMNMIAFEYVTTESLIRKILTSTGERIRNQKEASALASQNLDVDQ